MGIKREGLNFIQGPGELWAVQGKALDNLNGSGNQGGSFAGGENSRGHGTGMGPMRGQFAKGPPMEGKVNDAIVSSGGESGSVGEGEKGIYEEKTLGKEYSILLIKPGAIAARGRCRGRKSPDVRVLSTASS